jgi:NTE family protein
VHKTPFEAQDAAAAAHYHMPMLARPMLLLAVLLAGCAHYPVNARLEKFDPHAGYRFQNFPPSAANTDDLFIVLALSGGGARSAAFSYGVLEELQKTRITYGGVERPLLDEVDVITAVSGSSFTAAYYALRREKTFDEFPRRYLSGDEQGRLFLRAANPVNWARLASPTFDRIDLAAEGYDDDLFDHATYADLMREHRRPYVIISASDVTQGSRFEFTQEQFDFLYSDLASVPLARAVAASSAFPVFLSPLTFDNHPHGSDFTEPGWISGALADADAAPRLARRADDLRSYENAVLRPHVRLLDGAITDYMGLRGPMEGFQSEAPDFSIRRLLRAGKIKKLVIISVNAVRTPSPNWDRKPWAPGWYDMLWYTAATPIRNNSFETVTVFKDLLAADAKAVAGPPYESYFITVDFNGVPDEALRRRLENIETSLSLKPGEADDLRRGAAGALEASPEFNNLLNTLR